MEFIGIHYIQEYLPIVFILLVLAFPSVDYPLAVYRLKNKIENVSNEFKA